jgi:hypothetical protein
MVTVDINIFKTNRKARVLIRERPARGPPVRVFGAAIYTWLLYVVSGGASLSLWCPFDMRRYTNITPARRLERGQRECDTCAVRGWDTLPDWLYKVLVFFGRPGPPVGHQGAQLLSERARHPESCPLTGVSKTNRLCRHRRIVAPASRKIQCKKCQRYDEKVFRLGFHLVAICVCKRLIRP